MAGQSLPFHVLAFALYCALTVAFTWPLALGLAHCLPLDGVDPALNALLLWWNAHSLPFSNDWWSPPFFEPMPGALALSETLLGLWPLTTPLLLAGASPALAHNVAFLLSFPLSCLAMHALVLELTRRRDLAVLAGLAFGFAPYRAAHLGHLQVLCAFWIPLVFLGLHRYRRTGRERWLALFALAWLLQGLTNGYFVLFVSLFVPLWLAWFVLPERAWRALRHVLAWWLAAGALLYLALSGYPRWQATLAFQRSRLEIVSFSADLLGFVSPPAALAHWSFDLGLDAESWLFPGATLPLVLLFFLAARYRSAGVAALDGLLPRVAAAVAVAGAAMAAVTAWVGPWQLAVAGLALRGSAVRKPLAVAFYALILVVGASPALRRAWRRASPLAFYLLVVATAAVLALGPDPRAGGLRIWDAAPYGLLARAPGFSGLRAPARFAMLAVFGLVVAGTLALEAWLRHRRTSRRGWVVAVALGLLWDGWIRPLPQHPEPESIALPPAVPADAALLELPLGPAHDTAAMYRVTTHGHPVVNGYSGYAPSHYTALSIGVRTGDSGVLDVLRERRPLVVVVDSADPDAAALHALVAARPEAVALTVDDRRRAFVLPRRSASPPPVMGPALVPRGMRLAGARVVFDLGSVQPLGGVRLSFGRGVADLPPHVAIETAEVERGWRNAWDGPVAGLALAAALEDPERVRVLVPTPGASGRFVRIYFYSRPPVDEVVLLRPAQ